MKTWQNFSKTIEIPPGSRLIKPLKGEAIAVFNIDNQFFAIQDECPHAYLPFAEEGPLEGYSITCPHHGAQFCLKTGTVETPPAFDDLTCFTTRINGEYLQVLC
jgi:3-phenylpropionate/trans-cinnamate dioxygenase ferredoxin component